MKCTKCEGTGKQAGLVKCDMCAGSGVQLTQALMPRPLCMKCEGTGKVPSRWLGNLVKGTCYVCGGCGVDFFSTPDFMDTEQEAYVQDMSDEVLLMIARRYASAYTNRHEPKTTSYGFMENKLLEFAHEIMEMAKKERDETQGREFL